MEYIEVSAKTVSEAITKISVELGVPSDMLDIQIISEGNSGFLGFGSKPAVIKVCKKEDLLAEELAKAKEAEIAVKKAAEAARKEAEAAKRAAEAEKAEIKEKREKKDNRKHENRKNSRKNNSPERKELKAVVETKKKETAPAVKERPVPVKTPEEVEKMKKDAKEFLEGTFRAMGIEAVINMEYEAEEGCLNVDFEGDNMGVLIGKRGQTLDSLQYLTSLVINKGSNDYVRVKLDTEDYKRRRKETLENLARNIANKVKKTRKTVVLEPMNPYERRIIHSVLQSNKAVETYSEGSEPYRHIVVTPAKQDRK